MNASSESGLWAMEITRGSPGAALATIPGLVLALLTEVVSFLAAWREGPVFAVRPVRKRRGGSARLPVSAEAGSLPGDGGGGDHFEGVGRQEGQDGVVQESEGGEVGEDAEPECAESEGEQAAGGGDGQATGEAARAAMPERRNEEGDDGVAQQIAAGRAEQLGDAAETVGGEDGQAGSSLGEIGEHDSQGETGPEQQGEQQYGEGLEGDGNGGEVQRDGEMGADGDEGAGGEDDSGVGERGGAQEAGGCAGSGLGEGTRLAEGD